MISSKPIHISNLQRLFDLYKLNGSAQYDDQVSYIQHALQTVYWAEKDTSDVSLLFTAFIHGIGYLLPDAPWRGQIKIIEYHKLGAEFLLELGFKRLICDLVELQINAKRYLATTRPEYFENLSDIHLLNLELQGGLMTKKEERNYLQLPNAQQAIQLCIWSDNAEDPDLITKNFDFYKHYFTENIIELI